MEQARILNEIKIERMRQDKKWGAIASRSHEHLYWLAVLMEEVGEVATAIWEFVTNREKVQGVNHPIEPIKTELIQCAAVIVAWLEDKFDD